MTVVTLNLSSQKKLELPRTELGVVSVVTSSTYVRYHFSLTSVSCSGWDSVLQLRTQDWSSNTPSLCLVFSHQSGHSAHKKACGTLCK